MQPIRRANEWDSDRAVSPSEEAHGLYAGDVGEYAGDVGEYAGEVLRTNHS